MKINKFFLLLAALGTISAFLTYFFYNYFVIEDTMVLDMSVKVDDHFGINADADAIKFGMIMPGTSSKRSILINNNAAYPLRVVILKSGYIADWVKASNYDFILKENESKQMNFEVFAPDYIDFGNYTGKVKIIFKKTLFGK